MIRLAAWRRRSKLPFVVDESLHIDPAVIDTDAWLAWAEEHLDPHELERLKVAVEADRLEAMKHVTCACGHASAFGCGIVDCPSAPPYPFPGAAR